MLCSGTSCSGELSGLLLVSLQGPPADAHGSAVIAAWDEQHEYKSWLVTCGHQESMQQSPFKQAAVDVHTSLQVKERDFE
jgi:hypothetical protein